MGKKSLLTFHRTIFTGLVMLLVSLVPPMLNATAQGAEPLIAPVGDALDSTSSSIEQKRSVVNAGSPQAARWHILVELYPDAVEPSLGKLQPPPGRFQGLSGPLRTRLYTSTIRFLPELPCTFTTMTPPPKTAVLSMRIAFLMTWSISGDSFRWKQSRRLVGGSNAAVRMWSSLS